MKTFTFFYVLALVLALSTAEVVDSLEVSGLPYAARHNGEFILTSTYKNNPVYTSVKDKKWVIYKRVTERVTKNKWVLDFNAISEEYDGTVAWSESDADRPWMSTWKNGNVALNKM